MKLLHRLMLCFLLIPASAQGHDVDVTGVARIFLDEQSPGNYSLSVVDQQVPPLFNIERILPERCEGLTPGNFAYRFQCSPALNIADSLNFPWSLQGVVAIAHWADGEDVSGYFPGAGATITVPMSDLKAGAGSLGSLAYRYLVLGADHILFGIDHLLFVLGLLLLLSGFWKLLKTITAFTVAHSITLACAVLGIFPVPGPPIEVLIALSILMLAREVVMSQRGQMTLVHRKPWIVAFVFGLFHGFGFAGALGTLGLSDSDIPLALLFFNLGVEGGQVIFICTMILVNWVFRKISSDSLGSIHRGLAYGLGGIACFWFLERLPALFVAA
ncbi:MAG: HupE/UreJ family protein [Pseudohongiellaceae bacterium]|jgi:hydrogenase/urease accessory protein HupE